MSVSTEMAQCFHAYAPRFRTMVLEAITDIVAQNMKKGVQVSEYDIKEIVDIAFDVFVIQTKAEYDKGYEPHQAKIDADRVKSRLLFFLQGKSDRVTFMNVLMKEPRNGTKGNRI